MSPRAKTARNTEIYRADDEVWVSLRGPLAVEDIEALKKAVLPAITRGVQRVYVDLKSIDNMDSAGIGLLMKFKMTAKMHNAGTTLVDPVDNVAEVLAISRVDGIFDMVSGPDADVLRKRIRQPSNEWVDQQLSSSEDVSSPFREEGQSFPQVSSEGAFQDVKSEAVRVHELVEEQCRNAVEAMRQGNYENSIEAYKSALALDPNYLPALNNLAIVYEKQPVWRPLAVDIWNKVLELSRERDDTKHANRAERHLADLAD